MEELSTETDPSLSLTSGARVSLIFALRSKQLQKVLPIPYSFHPTIIMWSPLVFCFAVSIFLPLVLAHGSRFQRLRFGQVVTFGDSYMDIGNAYKLSHRSIEADSATSPSGWINSTCFDCLIMPTAVPPPS